MSRPAGCGWMSAIRIVVRVGFFPVGDAFGVVIAPFAAEGGGEDHGVGALDLLEGFAGGFFTLLGEAGEGERG